MESDLNRFVEAQQYNYDNALSEIKNGRKTSHWMWDIFPQLSGLGYSETSKEYAIKSKAEANGYLEHPFLGKRLFEILKVLLTVSNKTAYEIFGSPDDLKLHSSMTFFVQIKPSATVFQAVLDQFFKEAKSVRTLRIIESM
jgi:uncharacterized protein (DUF1810 family)